MKYVNVNYVVEVEDSVVEFGPNSVDFKVQVWNEGKQAWEDARVMKGEVRIHQRDAS